jgi:hypothetical protein
MPKYAAKGTILAYESATGPSVWSTIPSVDDFDAPATNDKEPIDSTDHDTGGYETTETGIGLAKEVVIPIKAWDGKSTHHAAMVTRCNADTLTNFKITHRDTSICTFAAKILSVDISAPVRGLLGATIRLKTSGAITYS